MRNCSFAHIWLKFNRVCASAVSTVIHTDQQRETEHLLKDMTPTMNVHLQHLGNKSNFGFLTSTLHRGVTKNWLISSALNSPKIYCRKKSHLNISIWKKKKSIYRLINSRGTKSLPSHYLTAACTKAKAQQVMSHADLCRILQHISLRYNFTNVWFYSRSWVIKTKINTYFTHR